jgi:hypothetical protein
VATAVTGAAMVVVASSLAPIRLGELPIDRNARAAGHHPAVRDRAGVDLAPTRSVLTWRQFLRAQAKVSAPGCCVCWWC